MANSVKLLIFSFFCPILYTCFKSKFNLSIFALVGAKMLDGALTADTYNCCTAFAKYFFCGSVGGKNKKNHNS